MVDGIRLNDMFQVLIYYSADAAGRSYKNLLRNIIAFCEYVNKRKEEIVKEKET